VKVDVLGHSVDKQLVGALTYFTFKQDGASHCAMGQVTEITLRNPWVEDSTMRSLIRQKGRVDPITERQDTHTATMTVGAVFSRNKNSFEQGELGTIPATGTAVKVVENELLDELLAPHEDIIYKIGHIYGTKTLFPAWFRHFGPGKGGTNEGYHIGIFGKTGSGKSVLAKFMLLGYAMHPQMSIVVIDPQGEFYADFSAGTKVRRFVEESAHRNVTVLNVRDLWLTEDTDRFEFFLELLSKTRFFSDLRIIHPANVERARGEILSVLRPGRRRAAALAPAPGLDRFSNVSSTASAPARSPVAGEVHAPKPWDLHNRDVFDKVWSHLGLPETAANIYTTNAIADAVVARHHQLDEEEVYKLWAGVPRFFTNRDRGSNVFKLSDFAKGLGGERGQFIVINLAEEEAAADLVWTDKMKNVVIRHIIEVLAKRGEEEYRKKNRLNTLVLLDEAHRFAPRDVPQDDLELAQLKAVLIDSVRTTRKMGLGWAFISQTLHSLDRELTMQLRVYIFGYGLAWGVEYNALRDLLGGSDALKLYQSFRDPEASLGRKQYPYMATGPLSPLSFSGTPLFFTALEWPDELLSVYAAKRSNVKEAGRAPA
jgi:hypothetical protein